MQLVGGMAGSAVGVGEKIQASSWVSIAWLIEIHAYSMVRVC
jgi:hypothetical protein